MYDPFQFPFPWMITRATLQFIFAPPSTAEYRENKVAIILCASHGQEETEFLFENLRDSERNTGREYILWLRNLTMRCYFDCKEP